MRTASASPRWPWATLLVVLATPALAREWSGVIPGETTKEQTVAKLGRPTRELVVKNVPVLLYSGRQSAPGTTQVQVRLDERLVVRRIDVFPTAPVERDLVEASYGAACAGGEPAAGCYVEKRTKEGRIFLDYSVDGLLVFFDPKVDKVRSFSFAPGAPKVAPTTKPDAGTGDNVAFGGGDTSDGTSPFGGEGLSEDEARAAMDKDPLQIGGDFYFRSSADLATADTGTCCSFNAGSSFLIDAYFDGRPSQHVRAMARPRFLYSQIPDNVAALTLKGQGNVLAALDQLWIGFDISNLAFVTVGRQHVTWGVSRLWSPTDFLAVGNRNPLAIFDARLGNDMVKLQVPFESIGVNTYAMLLINPLNELTTTIDPGAALRAEWSFWTAEIGIGAFVKRGRRPRYALDVSMGLGPVDVYGEIGLKHDSDSPFYSVNRAPDLAAGFVGDYTGRTLVEPILSGSGGIVWPVQLSESRSITVGGEFFYQTNGYADSSVMPWLYATGEYLPFYMSKAYAALFFTFEQSDPAITAGITTIGNLNDLSFVSRLDFGWRFFSGLRVEALVEIPFGRENGEFRPNFNLLPTVASDGRELGGLTIPLSWVRFGLALRVVV